MICENAQQNMILAQYGELPDELQFSLEQHLHSCEDCRREWNALQALDEELALVPVLEPSPNLLAASRMKLDELLDAMPPRSLGSRFTANFFRWMGTLQSAGVSDAAAGRWISGWESYDAVPGGAFGEAAGTGDSVEPGTGCDC